MSETLLIVTCVIVIAFIGYSLVVSKKDNSSGSDVLSTQLSNLMERFVKLEEAAKNMNTMQSSIDSTFKNFQGMLNDRQERGAFSEVELEKLLRDRLPKQYLKFQETLSNNKRVDCLIDFGDANSRICIDSKFVLENFKNYAAAENDEDIKRYKKLFEDDINIELWLFLDQILLDLSGQEMTWSQLLDHYQHYHPDIIKHVLP